MSNVTSPCLFYLHLIQFELMKLSLDLECLLAIVSARKTLLVPQPPLSPAPICHVDFIFQWEACYFLNQAMYSFLWAPIAVFSSDNISLCLSLCASLSLSLSYRPDIFR